MRSDYMYLKIYGYVTLGKSRVLYNFAVPHITHGLLNGNVNLKLISSIPKKNYAFCLKTSYFMNK